MTTYFKKRINKLGDWILPLNIKTLLLKLFGKKQEVVFDKHLEQKVDRGLHKTPLFYTAGVKSSWRELNDEFRSTIVLNKSINFSIKEKYPIKWVQIGFGVKNDRAIEKIDFLIDGVIKGTAHDVKNSPKVPEGGQWNDIRIPIDTPTNNIELSINISGNDDVYISHPLVFSEKKDLGMNKPKNIVCIVLDGVTSKFITDNNTPYIKQFFHDGVFGNQVFSQGDWTLPAFSSILTGLYPSKHGVYHPRKVPHISDDVKTIPELLLPSGYRTFGYSAHKRFIPPHGQAKGFERFIYRQTNPKDYYPTIISEAIQHLEAHRDEPNFLFLHLFDTHPLFEPSGYYKNIKRKQFRYVNKENPKDMDHYNDSLSSKLSEVDLALRSLFSYIQEQTKHEDTVVILTADHGITPIIEGKPLLLEHRVDVPLLVKGANIPKKQDNSFIEGSVDLLPSILSLAGIKPPTGINGRIWPFLGSERRKSTFSESLYKDHYQAVIRNENHSFHLKCPFDIESKTVFLNKKEIVVYERIDGNDIEDIKLPEHSENQEIFKEFKKHLEEAKDLKIVY